jgi:hypothetical protein
MILAKMRVSAVCLLFICSASFNESARASEGSLSFSRWRSNIDEAFKDKFLSPETAKTFVPWSRELGTTVRPDETAIAGENPGAVNAVETCRKTLMLGAALWLKAKNVLRDGPAPVGVNGAKTLEFFAKVYINAAEQCEDELHMDHPTNDFRRRFH